MLTIAIAVACATLSVSGCGENQEFFIDVGDCGYRTAGQSGRPSVFEHRPCDHPEAALVVVREAERAKCIDAAFGWSDRVKKRTRYICTQLNAKVGDCFNGLHYGMPTQLSLLRKVPCGSPGSYQVNTRVERIDHSVCKGIAKKHPQYEAIDFQQPPVSFCLHPVGR